MPIQGRFSGLPKHPLFDLGCRVQTDGRLKVQVGFLTVVMSSSESSKREVFENT